MQPAGGSRQLVVEAPSQLQLTRGQVLWLLMAAGLWIAGVVLVCVGIGALWGDSAAALGLVRLQWRLECCEGSCATARHVLLHTHSVGPMGHGMERVARYALQQPPIPLWGPTSPACLPSAALCRRRPDVDAPCPDYRRPGPHLPFGHMCHPTHPPVKPQVHRRWQV